MAVKAPPTAIPMARSTILPRLMNSRNSLISLFSTTSWTIGMWCLRVRRGDWEVVLELLEVFEEEELASEVEFWGIWLFWSLESLLILPL